MVFYGTDSSNTKKLVIVKLLTYSYILVYMFYFPPSDLLVIFS
jgi:hypothetical protein